MDDFNLLSAGEPAPWFVQRSAGNPAYHFDAAAGHYIVMCFFLRSADPLAVDALKSVAEHRHLFDDQKACFFGVTMDPEDERKSRLSNSLPGIRYFWDFNGKISRLYGSVPQTAKAGVVQMSDLHRQWVVLDPSLRVLKVVPFSERKSNGREVMEYLAGLPWPATYSGLNLQAPILVLPDFFDHEMCQKLIHLYQESGGQVSGFMREQDGKTVRIDDPEHKVRKDYRIDDDDLIAQIKSVFFAKAVPEIKKAYQYDVTRMERHIVVCYDAQDGGHFGAHRDNTTKGTAYRRFAVSVNLNDDFEGGEISFPEYGPQTFKPAPGGAVVFSCSLLHHVSRVTRGTRYAFLPFLYDDEAAKLREANNQYLGDGVEGYRHHERT